ncbi:MAG: chromate transporter [Chordicoccus sp.]
MTIGTADRRLTKTGKEQQMGQISGQYKETEQIGNHRAMLRSSDLSAVGAAAPVRTRRKGAAGLMLSLLKIGFAGFGGGCALIPVIEKEVVDDQKLVSKKEYNKDSLVACITPGALPVEISTGLGLKADGIRGMITAALAIALPGSFLTVLILALLSGADSALLAQIQFISIGLTAFISSLLLVYAKNAVKEARSGGRRHVRSTVIVIAGVFILTCGKTLSKLPFMNGHYLLGLSTIEVLGLAFFWIFYTKCERNKRRLAVAAGLTALYIACAGNWQLIPQQAVKSAAVLAMIVLAGLGLVRSIRSDIKESGKEIDRDLLRHETNELLKELAAWGLLIVAFAVPACAVTGKTPAYLAKGFISSVISFGGGDAYLSVADGMFVGSGITGSQFYQLLVPVANVLPGSILCKILTGVGYYVGFNAAGSTAAGLVVAVAGFAVSIAASGAVFCTIYHVYECMEQISVFRLIGKWIRPIISGLLLTVMASMIVTNISTGTALGTGAAAVLAITAGILAVDLYLSVRKKTGSLTVIGISSAAGILLMNLAVLA